jgi:pilus assembly protein Flp/PilA
MMWSLLKSWICREEGQSLVEYALILALVAIVLVAGLNALGVGITGIFNNVVNALAGA